MRDYYSKYVVLTYSSLILFFCLHHYGTIKMNVFSAQPLQPLESRSSDTKNQTGVTLLQDRLDRQKSLKNTQEQKTAVMSKEQATEAFLEEQEARLQHTDATCKQKKFKIRNEKSSYLPFYVNRAISLSYCPVFKAASTTWISVLKKLGPLLKSSKQKKRLTKQKEAKDTKNLIVVRHPFVRLVSCYRDKFENATKVYHYMTHGENMIKNGRGQQLNLTTSEAEKLLQEVRAHLAGGSANVSQNPFANPLGPTFEEFAVEVLRHPFADDHWRPINKQCSVCLIHYDYILKFEHLAAEAPAFLSLLNHRPLVIGHENTSPNGTVTDDLLTCTYFQQLEFAVADGLRRMYEYDFRLFGYEPDRYLRCTKNYE